MKLSYPLGAALTLPFMAVAALPSRFGMVLFPGFQNIEVAGAIESLFSTSIQRPLNLTMIAYTLDPVSSLTPPQTRIGSTFSTSLVPTHTFANPPADIDVLFVPGGLGNRALSTDHRAALLGYLQDVYPSLQYLLSICTGSGLLAQAGLLDGRNATTNKWAWYETVAHGPKTNWIAKARWVVDGNIYTSSGVAAGIDAAFAFVSDVFGEDVAARAAQGLEYIRVTDATNDPFAEVNGAVDVPPVRPACK
ncbi:DJ-1/PfpI family protein [Plectosphaerella plurivora]|uniref:DJ-1/PfpI family protein n=1 Tax=Plectosphaerella plurivora TaxID=936078 RepID=A0A9P8VAW2_9PEZI|nr:DJ-1/PfpI family protein [Plectosphaerella plurivora]